MPNLEQAQQSPVEELAASLMEALGTGASVWRRRTSFGEEVWLVVCGKYEEDVLKAWDRAAPFLAAGKIDGFKILEKSWLRSRAKLPEDLSRVEVSAG